MNLNRMDAPVALMEWFAYTFDKSVTLLKELRKLLNFFLPTLTLQNHTASDSRKLSFCHCNSL